MAWAGHAPGLWLIYGEPVPRELRRANLVGALATVAAVIAAAVLAPSHRVLWGLGAWIVGHVAWGTYLAWHLPGEARRCGCQKTQLGGVVAAGSSRAAARRETSRRQ